MNRKSESLGKPKLVGFLRMYFQCCFFRVQTQRRESLACGGDGKGIGVFGFEQEMLAFEVIFSSTLSDARDRSKVVTPTLRGSIS